MSMQLTRYSTALKYVQHPVQVRTGGPPTVYQQAEEIGGKFTRIFWGLPEGSIGNFSPSLINRDGHRLISWRSQPEPFIFRHD